MVTGIVDNLVELLKWRRLSRGVVEMHELARASFLVFSGEKGQLMRGQSSCQ
jgi:hypothetical protein